ncbi:unnamed protein product [Aspergillus oryzae RIB40]|uniref:DNA, SC113 n=1 Tax=Aspergillus oryzae (strain ATCC 42149 / RIB 40) TaxID=510516 RepID=Q2U720_ASPOR|nr:unnamed protein product [Aspergillus oryzae RIB40]BAE62645.1 unnamed protein product [Aspergillus oryzae RIB40]
MKLFAILSSTVLASVALASPLTLERRARNAARLQARVAQRHSNLPFKAGTNEILHLNETTHEECQSAILQTGVDFCIDSSGTTSDAWYEWFPDYSHDFSGISISAGDKVKVTVDASSKTAGTAIVENLTTGKTVSHTFAGQDDNALCETNAEWIMEDFSSFLSLVPFANFGTVTFTDISATSGDSSVGASNATIIDIQQNNKTLTSSSASDTEVTIKYIG